LRVGGHARNVEAVVKALERHGVKIVEVVVLIGKSYTQAAYLLPLASSTLALGTSTWYHDTTCHIALAGKPEPLARPPRAAGRRLGTPRKGVVYE
jgi:hypothetical protein